MLKDLKNINCVRNKAPLCQDRYRSLVFSSTIRPVAERCSSREVLRDLSIRTLECWEKSPEFEDGLKGPHHSPHALSSEEKDLITAIVKSEKYRDLGPAKIVLTLADEGKYIASESSFFTVHMSKKMISHRSNSSPASPEELKAMRPNKF